MIFKYQVLPGKNGIIMSKDAKILHVREQRDSVCIWALVGGTDEVEERTFYVFGTGHEFSVDSWKLDYLGTAHLLNGALIWHVFELKSVYDETRNQIQDDSSKGSTTST